MNKRMIVPLIFGLVGAAILVSLGVWQLQRLNWKQGILSTIEMRITAPPVVALPAAPVPDRDQYLSVLVTGEIGPEEIHVLASRKQIGAGYRVISPFTIGERRVLLDRGFIPVEEKNSPRIETTMPVEGNLHWPQETDGFTPVPDLGANIWFARDVEKLAAALNTEPVLIVARSNTGDGIEPYPVDTAGIPNDHLQYAITWFSLATVWLGMTVFLLWRIKRRTD